MKKELRARRNNYKGKYIKIKRLTLLFTHKNYSMTTEQIAKFFSVNKNQEVPVRISFKTRNNVIGIFIKTPDFDELKSKNFWRIVSEANFEQWKQ